MLTVSLTGRVPNAIPLNSVQVLLGPHPQKNSANENWKIIVPRPPRIETDEKVFYPEKKILFMPLLGCQPYTDRLADGQSTQGCPVKFSASPAWSPPAKKFSKRKLENHCTVTAANRNRRKSILSGEKNSTGAVFGVRTM